jgi:hypothetical protein
MPAVDSPSAKGDVRRVNGFRRVFAEITAKPDAIWETVVGRWPLLPWVALIATVLANGLGTVPAETVRELHSFAADPFSPRLLRTFEGETPFFFFMAQGLGAVTIPRYLALCASLVVLAYVLVYVAERRAGAPPALLCVLLFAAHPIATILQTWLGMVDCLTVVCTVALLFSQSLLAVAAASLVLTLNHTAALIITLPLLVLRWLSRDSGAGAKQVGVALAALLTGRVLLLVVHGGQLATRFGQMRGMRWTHWANINITHFPLIVYSMCFALWIPVVLMILLFFNRDKRLYGFYLLCMAGFYAITIVTMDTTRVFALLSWAPTLFCLMHTWRKTPGTAPDAVMFRASVVASVLLGWWMPRLFVWDGKLYAPWLSQPITLLWERLSG